LEVRKIRIVGFGGEIVAAAHEYDARDTRGVRLLGLELCGTWW